MQTHHRDGPTAPVIRLALITLATLVASAGLVGCGGSSSSNAGESASSLASQLTSAAAEQASAAAPADTPSTATAASSSAPAAGTGDDAVGTGICTAIKSAQKDMKTIGQTDAAGYLANFTRGVGNVVVDEDTANAYHQRGDALARAACPQEYAAFLTEAKVTSISGIV